MLISIVDQKKMKFLLSKEYQKKIA